MGKNLGSVPALLAFAHAAAMTGLLLLFGRAGTTAELLLFSAAALLQLVVVVHTALAWLATRGDDRARSPLPRRWRGGSIDVFVTVCGEPLEVVLPVIRAARDLRLPHDTWVLDDGGDSRLRAACLADGIAYLARPDRRGGKAGNVNHALARTDGDLVAILDADHRPEAGFLARTVEYFGDEGVAFVQTPQSYVVQDTWVARGARQAQSFFYRYVMPGKARSGAAICVGTNVVLRRAALEQVGGLYEGSQSEDVHTSLRLHALGWRSVFVPETLAYGLPPQNWPAYLRQQRRWARGAFEILASGALWRRGHLDAGQRLQYGMLGTHYLSSICSLLASLFPGVHLLTRESPLAAPPAVLAGLLASAVVTIALAHRAQGADYGVAGALAHLVAGPVHLLALLDVVVRRRTAWVPTHGAGGSSRAPGAWGGWTQATVAAIHLSAAAAGVVITAARLGHAGPAAVLGVAAAADLWVLLPLVWCLATGTVLLLPLAARLRDTAAAMTRPVRRTAAVSCCLVLVLASAGIARMGGAPSDRRPSAMTPPVTWREDFTGPAGSQPSKDRWTFVTGRHYPGGPPSWGTGEVQTYVRAPENLRLDGRGNLEIVATADDDGHYRSARIETRRRDFFPPPGGTLRIQARAALPSARGSWATFWALGSSFRDDLRWPESGEIDVIEYRGSRPDEVYGVLHCTACSEPAGRRSSRRDPAGLADAFHTFTVDWRSSPERMDWYLDGEPYQTITPETLGENGWDFHQPVFLLLNLAVGGHWPGTPRAGDFPATLTVDYVEARVCPGACPPPPAR
ncbi:glycosyltransferase family 2 protein [Nonomuraea sp. NPDC050783]|uniref:glycosyltransferase family 2 protein n=1 Tax=Nonomuraea sp. NPDC050783 TaxID=3154634 RepID=UPI0034669304